MLLSEAMTALMDKFRGKTGLTDKLSILDATGLMDHLDLHVNPNLFTNLSSQDWHFGNGGTWDNPYPDPMIKTSVAHMYANSNRGMDAVLQYQKPVSLEQGKTYTISLIARLRDGAPKEVDFPFCMYSDYTDKFTGGAALFNCITLHSEWHFYASSFTSKATGVFNNWRLIPYIEQPIPWGSIWVANVKMEVGDLATPLQKVGGGS